MNHAKLSRKKELGGKTRVLVRVNLPSVGGEGKQGSDPHVMAIVSVRGETFNADSDRADLWQPKWNENQTVLATATHTQQGCRSPGRCSGWELEFRDCGVIPGRGLLLMVEGWIKRM